MSMPDIEQKRIAWWTDALKTGQTVGGICDKCGVYRPGFACVVDRSFTCLVCRAKQLFPDKPEPKEPFPVAELKYGGLVPLDVEDFAKV